MNYKELSRIVDDNSKTASFWVVNPDSGHVLVGPDTFQNCHLEAQDYIDEGRNVIIGVGAYENQVKPYAYWAENHWEEIK